jgi:hypothetical protein
MGTADFLIKSCVAQAILNKATNNAHKLHAQGRFAPYGKGDKKTTANRL